ncbi:MAG: flagellar basal body rod protein FlgB [Spirochaetia bacterium]|nr:flagellar basal body rod protein FlgB [Spirochaetia bacterium]
MFESSHFMKTQDLLERGLNSSLVKRRVIADNISNVDVPGFKRSEVSFEENLKRAIESEKVEKLKTVPTKVSDERHINFFNVPDYKSVSPSIKIDYLTRVRADGNNVDMEKEMTDASHNQMHYFMMVERLNHNFKQINLVLKQA